MSSPANIIPNIIPPSEPSTSNLTPHERDAVHGLVNLRTSGQPSLSQVERAPKRRLERVDHNFTRTTISAHESSDSDQQPKAKKAKTSTTPPPSAPFNQVSVSLSAAHDINNPVIFTPPTTNLWPQVNTYHRLKSFVFSKLSDAIRKQFPLATNLRLFAFALRGPAEEGSDPLLTDEVHAYSAWVKSVKAANKPDFVSGIEIWLVEESVAEKAGLKTRKMRNFWGERARKEQLDGAEALLSMAAGEA